MDFNRKCKEELLQIFELKDFPDNLEHSTEKLLCNRKIILYGAGAGFQTFYNLILTKYNLQVEALVDKKFKSKGKYYGFVAYPPDEYFPTEEEKEKSVVVITVGKQEYYEEILDFLKNLGFKNIIFAHDIYEFNLPYVSDDLKVKGFKFYLENKDKILSCLELFHDNLSLQVYNNFIKIHMLRKLFSLPYSYRNEQYFPPDIKFNKGYDRFIHCGAFDGSTIQYLNKKVGKIKALICFEPNLENFHLLSKYIIEKKDQIADEIICFPCGVFSKEIQLRFKNEGESSHISENGDSFMQCVALDNALPNFRLTFISMDIEGAELEALKGAERSIRGNKPDLAISVYHLPNHIWEIPLYIEKLSLGYKFYLRNYSGKPIETVLYATVDE